MNGLERFADLFATKDSSLALVAPARPAAAQYFLALAEDSQARSDPVSGEQPVVRGGSRLGAQHRVKAYKVRRVVNDVSLDLARAEIGRLLGPNGAGKTTSF